MSRRRARLVRSPLSGAGLQEAIEIYNSYVPQHNANELDWSKPIPSDRDEWSPIVNVFAEDLHANRHVAFWIKPDFEKLIVIRIKDMLTFKEKGLSPLRNTINPENVRRAYIYS